MLDFVTRDQYGIVLQRLEQYTTLDSFNKMRMGIERDIEMFKKKFLGVPVKDDLEKLFSRTRAYIEEAMRPLSEKRHCLKDKNDM